MVKIPILHKATSTFFVLAFSLCLMLNFGCRDKCKRVDCVEGTCVDGTCECNEGYFGELCNQVLNANYNNAFALTENCTAGADLYDVTIQASSTNKSEIQITGLWEQSNSMVTAQIASDGYAFSISRQSIANNRDIVGNATVNNDFDEITLDYDIYVTSASQPFEQCSATLVKK